MRARSERLERLTVSRLTWQLLGTGAGQLSLQPLVIAILSRGSSLPRVRRRHHCADRLAGVIRGVAARVEVAVSLNYLFMAEPSLRLLEGRWKIS